MSRRRSGFALLTVLWVMVAASVLALTGTLAARDNVGIAGNRVSAERARWRALDCIARARASVDEALDAAVRDDAALQVWRALDRAVAAPMAMSADGCEARLEAAGSRLDINVADARQLVAVFHELRLPDAEGLADRLIDWRDPDDEPRPNGAEQEWYAMQQRVLPRNAPFADLRELRRVSGFEALEGLDLVLGVEGAHISLNTAPPAVLAAVPGFTAETVERIVFDRERGRQVADVLAFVHSLSRPSADSITAHFQEIAELTTVNPAAWIVVAHGWTGTRGAPESVVFADARLILGQRRAIVTRLRTWQ